MSHLSNEEALEAMRKDCALNRLCFLAGAAISAPSGSPMAGQLVENVVRRLLVADSEYSVKSLVFDDHLRNRFLDKSTISSVRLEVLLGSIDSREISAHPENYYTQQVAQAITAGTRPNQFHRFLASGLSGGAIPAVFTTNWDTLIEQSFPSPNVRMLWSPAQFQTVTGWRNLLVKLHGTAANSDDDAGTCLRKRKSLVADPTGLGGPLPSEMERVLTGFLQSENRSICVVGYSGRDPDIHPSLRITTTRMYWIIYPHQPKSMIDAEKARLRRLLPHADLNFLVCDMGYLLGRLGGSACLETAPTPKPLPDVYADLPPAKRLIALGLALSHAATGDSVIQCFAKAYELAPNDILTRFSLAREHSVMYRTWVPLPVLLSVWWRARSSRNAALSYDAYFYFLLALENISVANRRIPFIGRPLCAVLLGRRFFSFSEMERKLLAMKRGTGMEWLRTRKGQRWARLALRFIHFVLTSTRLHCFTASDTILQRLFTALRIAQELRSPSLQGQVYRYMGRFQGIHGYYSSAQACYEEASYWFEAIDDKNGSTEVNKYRLKTLLGCDLRGQSAELYELAKRLKVYEKEREHIPAYARHVLEMMEGQGLRRRFSTLVVRHVWPRVMRSRFYF